MEQCPDCQYKFNTFLGVDFNDFNQDFEVVELWGEGCVGIGDAICKKCKKAFSWEHENFIHSKLRLSPKNNDSTNKSPLS
jgi:hypothetical protein